LDQYRSIDCIFDLASSRIQEVAGIENQEGQTLEISAALILCLAAMLTAAVSAVLGMAGGSMLLAVMLLFLDPIEAIPIHGLVQLSSNGTRTVVHAKVIRWELLAPFAVLVLPAGLLTIGLVEDVPADGLRLVIGVFVLISTWRVRWLLLGLEPTHIPERLRFGLLGAITGALSPLIGATGPFIAPFFLGIGLTRFELIGTKAACQAITHLAKIVLFGFIGFAFVESIPLIVGMALSVVVGTALGTRLLHRLDDARFVQLYKVALTLVAVRLVWSGLPATAFPG
jgi:uncharacterized protein